MKNFFVTLLLCLTPLLGKAQKQMGVQLYSVRTLIGSAEQFAQNGKQVLSELAGMGYTAAEPANYADGKFYGLSPLEFKKVVNQAGLQLISSHTTLPLSQEELDSGDFQEKLSWWNDCIAAHKAAGIHYLIFSWAPQLKSKHEIEIMTAYLKAIGQLCHAAGLQFGYHSHSQELRKVEDTTMLDEFISNTTPEEVVFEMDVYWAVMAGVSPVAYMKKYPGRFPILHIKDQFELGQSGMVGFDAIFNNFQVAGTRHYVVEMERPGNSDNPLQGLKECADYLMNAEFVQPNYDK